MRGREGLRVGLARRDWLRLAAAATIGGRPVRAAFTRQDRSWAEAKLAGLSPAERIGQLMSVHHGLPGLQDGVRRGRAGSLQVPRGGGTTAADVIEFINGLQGIAGIPLLMMGGAEAGVGQVAREATTFPNNMALGATRSEELAYAAANATAKEARALGIDWPGLTVADVNSNPANPIINTRSFGDSPLLVSRLVAASIRGVQEERLISTANHFPGHGGTSQDSHLELPVVDRTREDIDDIDLPPFVAAIEAGVATMCTAHICYPALEPDVNTPATMSSVILTDILRKQLGFEGFVHSDSFAMEAIRGKFSIPDAAVRSVRAGCDVLLSYPDWDACHEALVRGIEADAALRARVDESCLRILQWKHWTGLIERKPLLHDRALAVLDDPRHKQVAKEIAQAAVTAVRGKEFLESLGVRHNVAWVVGAQRNPLESPPANEVLVKLLRESWPAANVIELGAEPGADESRTVLGLAETADAVVFLGFTQVRNHDPHSVRFPKEQARVMRRVSELLPTAICCFGSPYALREWDGAVALACMYDKIPVCLQAGIDALLGRIPWHGALPVRLTS